MSRADLADLASQKYVNLTTFRRATEGSAKGVGVTTPVWVAPHGSKLLVMTQGETGKVKRIRHTPDVTLQACTQRGKPIEGAPIVAASAVILTGADALRQRDESFAKKYGFAFRVFLWLGRRRAADSVVLEISLAD
jgi:PPOX class probable F420-dependent enzyme